MGKSTKKKTPSPLSAAEPTTKIAFEKEQKIPEENITVEEDKIDDDVQVEQAPPTLEDTIVGELSLMAPFLVLQFGIFFLGGFGTIFPETAGELFQPPLSAMGFTCIMMGIYYVARASFNSLWVYRSFVTSFTSGKKGSSASFLKAAGAGGFLAFVLSVVWGSRAPIGAAVKEVWFKNILVIWCLKNWEYVESEFYYFCRITVLILALQVLVTLLMVPFMGLKWISGKIFKKK
mmetsp:Transcript_26481/g.41807  ORF Transcript_26481/g.41807 Transcript_26481/m.41807 type:complete len:233 (+) Transcript_26481:83-781(+)